mmetsp:Transcript_52250/g.122005  ORF Transcript_52250/g.122005 Transcript_52250/m.122005 type:complete len:227 (-) Transcript_52250:3-683(-)
MHQDGNHKEALEPPSSHDVPVHIALPAAEPPPTDLCDSALAVVVFWRRLRFHRLLEQLGESKLVHVLRLLRRLCQLSNLGLPQHLAAGCHSLLAIIPPCLRAHHGLNSHGSTISQILHGGCQRQLYGTDIAVCIDGAHNGIRPHESLHYIIDGSVQAPEELNVSPLQHLFQPFDHLAFHSFSIGAALGNVHVFDAILVGLLGQRPRPAQPFWHRHGGARTHALDGP